MSFFNKIVKLKFHLRGAQVPNADAAVEPRPFPGHRKYRWIIRDRHGNVVYEGLPSSQAMQHALKMRDAEIWECDRRTPYCVLLTRGNGDHIMAAIHRTMWDHYHKQEPSSFFGRMKKGTHAIQRRKATPVRAIGF